MKHGIQKAIADKIGVSPAFINGILHGRKRPSWKTANKLAEATGTNPVLWMDGSPCDIRSAVSKMIIDEIEN